jgi:hypothetical protein
MGFDIHEDETGRVFCDMVWMDAGAQHLLKMLEDGLPVQLGVFHSRGGRGVCFSAYVNGVEQTEQHGFQMNDGMQDV